MKSNVGRHLAAACVFEPTRIVTIFSGPLFSSPVSVGFCWTRREVGHLPLGNLFISLVSTSQAVRLLFLLLVATLSKSLANYLAHIPMNETFNWIKI
jgi:hypothetical protein